MSRFPLRTAALLAGFAGVVCGVAGPAAATEPVPPATADATTQAVTPAPAAEPVPPAAANAVAKAVKAKRAVAVVVVRTGGRQHGQAVYTLVGAASREQAEVLRLASSPAFQSLRPKYSTAHAAGSRYTYRIEVGYRDNSKKRVIVVDRTPGTPKVALDLIRMMTDVPMPDLSDMTVAFPPGFPFN